MTPLETDSRLFLSTYSTLFFSLRDEPLRNVSKLGSLLASSMDLTSIHTADFKFESKFEQQACTPAAGTLLGGATWTEAQQRLCGIGKQWTAGQGECKQPTPHSEVSSINWINQTNHSTNSGYDPPCTTIQWPSIDTKKSLQSVHLDYVLTWWVSCVESNKTSCSTPGGTLQSTPSSFSVPSLPTILTPEPKTLLSHSGTSCQWGCKLTPNDLGWHSIWLRLGLYLVFDDWSPNFCSWSMKMSLPNAFAHIFTIDNKI